ncbi:carbamoyl phosphate synthase small subunit [Lederbergia sp. NSJ-179]|uniref:carbamoyl phosphate synthase small subunit n=1 Tax=Lederbergia sp. NSJ-179 TaxID=2931402 RepID=UPI001FD3FD55|nr:carbamoyl phosphate synthase small subunit [Lederbergia sp. NSJ-179]MCJ7842056.1 carbamoyl phosphate synthase small subunit [Lederbergia sp. NSJ-179]
MKTGFLKLETGEQFKGELLGDLTGSSGEVVFHTSMTGYQEILTDPSYMGQIIVFSYPLIGNYGIMDGFNESQRPYVKGMVAGEICTESSHFAQTGALIDLLDQFGIPALTGVDTRALVKTIRHRGTVQGVISDRLSEDFSFQAESNLFHQVTTTKIEQFANPGPHVVLLDYGYKKSIVDYLLKCKCKVTVVPYHEPLERIMAMQPDGIVISNGPGNPADAIQHLPKIRKLTNLYPTMGICLGHQLIAMAYGAKTTKLPFGHRGGNHPVKDMKTGKVYMTSQNHGYVVIDQTIDQTLFTISYQHINDGSIEGLVHKEKPIMTIQFHPEAHPGPQDTEFIFMQFLQQMKSSHWGGVSYAIQ